MKKVVGTTWQGEEHFVLVIISHVSGRLAWFRDSDELWRIIPYVPMELICNDFVFSKGLSYAVDDTSQIIMVGSDLSVLGGQAGVQWKQKVLGGERGRVVAIGQVHALDEFFVSQ